MYTIDKGVPIPRFGTPYRKGTKDDAKPWPFKRMEVGDSSVVQDREYPAAMQACRGLMYRKSWQFVAYRENATSIRIWRVR
jgi:hypothetical protein